MTHATRHFLYLFWFWGSQHTILFAALNVLYVDSWTLEVFLSLQLTRVAMAFHCILYTLLGC